jgi:hypothetical protein
MPSSFHHKIQIALSILALLALTYLLGYNVGQSDFQPMIYYYATFFGIYLAILHYVKTERTIWYFVGLGIILRFILVFAFPNLSDDVYRFIWDGRLITQGINPFNHLPGYFLEAGNAVEGLDQALYDQLNSPNYYTIYPPVSQAIYAIATWLAPDSYYGASTIMKSFLFAMECGSIYLIARLIRHFGLPLQRVLIYALNPLIILEITGNLHFEGAMIFFLLLSLTLLVHKHFVPSAITFALSIAAKLLPLMFLPYLIKRLGWKRAFGYFTILGLTLLICFSPLLNITFIENFRNSLDLYFRKFEFNASIYYAARWIGTQIRGYNMIQTIGPLLALCILSTISISAYKEKKLSLENLFEMMLFAICIYLFLATTIHPWYVAMPLALCTFTSWRFPILWSALIMLTYINYSYEPYRENLWIVSVEYILVFGYLIYELKYKVDQQSSLAN